MRLWFKTQGKGNSILFPLGGDQAPAEHFEQEFFDVVNSIQNEFNYVLKSNFNDFFEEYKNNDSIAIHECELKTPITGCIHRTISSAKSDIKYLLRKCETDLYYQLEPLELIYKNIDDSYDFEEYKMNKIIKLLLKLQAHDSLGGCNSDMTNNDIVANLRK